MLFESTIRRELRQKFLASSLILVAIVMTIILIRYLGQASKGNLNPKDIFLLISYATVGRLATLLTLALFLSVVNTLLRMYRDSEMVVWYGSGQTPIGLLKPLFSFAWPVLIVIGLASIVIWPETTKRSNDLRNSYLQRGDIERIVPGVFQESANGERTFFVENTPDPLGPSAHVFISDQHLDKSSVTSALAGQFENVFNQNFLVLKSGEKIIRTTGKLDIQITSFEEYGAKISSSESSIFDTPKTSELTTRELVSARTNPNLGELSSRIGIVVSAINLIFLAVSFVNVSSRSARNLGLAFMILLFILYNNLINLGQAWISSGAVNFWALMIFLHGSVLFLCMFRILKSQWGINLRNRRR